MIENKEDLKDFVREDMKANRFCKRRLFFSNDIFKYLLYLRIVEFLMNTNNKFLCRIAKRFLYKQSVKTGISIPPNTFGKGLFIPHYGCIIVNSKSSFGKNCIVQCGVNISENVIGGDNLYLGAGAKILTGVSLANGIIVGANAVVTKSFTEDNIVVAGCPAKEVSKRGMFSDRDVI